ncbi:MAG: hypothetical protein IPM51_09720 [Sphingobacteriaceae bacterium]|nr:hypothetical protein [Sphingobacteriaceae bacterium]
MTKTIIFLFAFVSLLTNAQIKPGQKASAADKKKFGGYTVTSVDKAVHLAKDISKINITFIGANNKPVKKGVKIIFDNDSIIPELSEGGIFSSELEPGKHEFSFSVPYWYKITTVPINFKEQHIVYMKVKFEAQELSAR